MSTARRHQAANDLRLFGRGLGLVVTAAPVASAASLALALLLAANPAVQVWLSKLVVDRLATGSAPLVVATLYGLTLVVPALVEPLQRMTASEAEDHAVGEVERRLMATGTRLVDLDRIERPSFHDQLRVLREAKYWPPRLIHATVQLVRGPLSLVAVLAVLAALHPLLPLGLAAVMVPRVLAEARFHRGLFQAMVESAPAARETDYCARVVTEPAGAKEVRVFGAGSFFLERFRDRCRAALDDVHRVRVRGLWHAGGLAALEAGAVAAGFVYVAHRAAGGALSVGDVALYLNAMVHAHSGFFALSGSLRLVQEGLLRLRVLFPFLDGAVPALALTPPGAGRDAPERLSRGIELDRVSFGYPESVGVVLDDFTGMIPAGKVTALVGANGAGKSTLVKLLTRMYDPAAGEIRADGHPLPGYDLQSWRARVSVVHQDFARFALSLHDNVAVGAGGRDDDGRLRARVEQSSHWAGVDELAERLPGGFQTELTRRFEGGVELSGGEWQKVALARGFVREAGVVVLDEPTAGLDAEAEEHLFHRFRELLAGRTGVLISHRFSTVRMADRILVVEQGRVVESGSHEALVARGGRYARLYEMQAGRYR